MELSLKFNIHSAIIVWNLFKFGFVCSLVLLFLFNLYIINHTLFFFLNYLFTITLPILPISSQMTNSSLVYQCVWYHIFFSYVWWVVDSSSHGHGLLHVQRSFLVNTWWKTSCDRDRIRVGHIHDKSINLCNISLVPTVFYLYDHLSPRHYF